MTHSPNETMSAFIHSPFPLAYGNIMSPDAVSALIVFALAIVLVVILYIRVHNRTRFVKHVRKDLTRTPQALEDEHRKANKKAMDKLLEQMLSVLKEAAVKETYPAFNVVYTIPVDKRKAALYIWAMVLAGAKGETRLRIVRIAALIMAIFPENKDKSVFELEAQVERGCITYAKAYGLRLLELTSESAKINDNMYEKLKFIKHMNPAGVQRKFTWPACVKQHVVSIRNSALKASDARDIYTISLFKCSKCGKETPLEELHHLRCKNCRALT